MTINQRVKVDDVVDAFTKHMKLPRKFVRQVVAAEKAHDRIASAKPVSPPLTPRALARLILAMTAPSVGRAVDTEKSIGALPLAVGDGQPDVETHLTDIVEEACGWRYGDSDFRDGTFLVGHDNGTVVAGSDTYRSKMPEQPGMLKFTLVHNRAIAAIARELLPNERGVA
ncbi:hypothetical protein [Mesorhizobium sp.]|uniref:hypothetical protein n=1 Tax=Mesorhizobium sp. TaxID=1871066 RepID=UPI000FE9B8A4|nr:hypothetical protein [Mesorhizobium sp.]RWO53695.1 MAG: hypothetical protein EOS13_10155 [Mesorhizobium sp.]TIN27059.1 MAG: hypothetical protein E5Y19_10970 [Mesorhizobium sp.]TJU88944.1 MAG: hypothetical protein E5Y15_04825 [Mesorhizobium sp.]